MLPLVLVALAGLPTAATVHEYAENFTTKDYCDMLNTAADWDTLSGEVKPHRIPQQHPLGHRPGEPTQRAPDLSRQGALCVADDVEPGRVPRIAENPPQLE